MKQILIFSFLVLLTGTLNSCQQNTAELKQNLSGYWEIEKVTTLEGETKEFKISIIVDYITIEGNTGKRTKVSPQLDGSFKNNSVVESFTIDGSSGELVLRYQTPLSAWNEKVKKATNEKLVVVNNEGKEYVYKRFEKLNIY
jgi:hypothetical protein